MAARSLSAERGESHSTEAEKWELLREVLETQRLSGEKPWKARIIGTKRRIIAPSPGSFIGEKPSRSAASAQDAVDNG